MLCRKKLLSQEFARVRVEDVKNLLTEKNGCLLPTYLALEDVTRRWAEGGDPGPLQLKMKKTSTAPEARYLPANIDAAIHQEANPTRKEVLEELKSARQLRQVLAAERGEEEQKLREEADNLASAQRDGTIAECGCCFGESALNRMVHCNGEGEHVSLSYFLPD